MSEAERRMMGQLYIRKIDGRIHSVCVRVFDGLVIISVIVALTRCSTLTFTRL